MTDLMKDLTDIEQAQLDKLNQAADDGAGVRLPFPALYIHVRNGDARMKDSTATVQYFGGFEGDADKMGEMMEAGDLQSFPQGWVSYSGVGRENNEYNAIGYRKITIAVIKGRASWLSKDGKSRAPVYSPVFSRRHLQYLALMYQPDFVVPVVITAKGYQAQNMTEAIGKWESAIKPFRKELNAIGLPRSAFWITVGTDGTKPNYVKVGSDAQSTITPISAIIPEGLTAEAVAKRFVGKANLMKCAELLAQAEEWLGAWKQAETAPDLVRELVANADPITGEIAF